MVLCFTTEKQLSCLDDCNFLLLPRLGSLPIRAKYFDYVENYFLFKKKIVHCRQDHKIKLFDSKKRS